MGYSTPLEVCAQHFGHGGGLGDAAAAAAHFALGAL